MTTLWKRLTMGLVMVLPVASQGLPASFSGVSLPAVAVPAGDEISHFTVDTKTQVPGKTLKPGAYTIRIMDHLSDRMIVRIDRDGKQETTFLALPVSSLPKPAAQGAIRLSNGPKGKDAIRGFAFPNGTLAEFVYPKEEAVGIAKANNTKIPAVDPASEGRSADPNLSSEDMKMVTLWMLSPQTVGPDASGGGIAAERYQAPVQTASAAAPPRPKMRPVMKALPHTASSMPEIELLGLLCLSGAGWLSWRRMRRA